MIIDSIENGIVIDHICAGKGMELYNVLNLERLTCPVALLKNVSSLRRSGKKDIIKIDELINIDWDILGYIDPSCTVNIIKNGKVFEKKLLELPEKIINVIKCNNPRCITSVELSIPQVFKLTEKESGVYRCAYCETKANTTKKQP
ncbi:MAG: aspartate carbamoyltransferase regulatory subunit [Oscillospiraceae bacterium]|nr:aspartate carbamoyltransferase regulatory subunit [Oscillospiraceae bacterium]